MGTSTGTNGSCYRVPTKAPSDLLIGALRLFLIEAPKMLAGLFT